MKTKPLKLTPHLTNGFSPEIEYQLRRSVAGMAHFAATGPLGATCKACREYGYWRQHYNKSGDLIHTEFRWKACGVFHTLTAQHGAPIPESTPACRYFVGREGNKR